MVPRSFFQQVLPDGFVDAGFCCTALHWLRERPAISNHDGIPFDFPSAAHKDLIDFLCARHRELRQGGILSLAIPARGAISATPALQCLEAVVKELSHEYRISPSIVARLPLYFRTKEEIIAAVSASSDAWEILQASLVPIEHPSSPRFPMDATCTTTRARSLEIYAIGITGFTMAPLSGFLMEDVRHNMGNDYPGDVIFLDTLRLAFEREFLRSHIQEKVGFNYAFLHLQKVGSV